MTAAVPDGPAEPATISEPTDSDATPTDAPETVADPPPSDSEPSPNSEAARYRVQLREVQAERDALTERLTGYQRRECEAAVADLLEEPADLWDIGQADLSAFYDDDGTLDEEQLRAAAGALIDQRPKLGKPRGPSHHNFGQFSKPPPRIGIAWDAVLKQ
jgi:hypothetical protein